MKRILIMLAIVACNDRPPVPPPEPPVCSVWSAPEGCDCSLGETMSPILGVCAPPRVDRPVDWGAVRGVTMFGLTVRSTSGIVDMTKWIHAAGWTTMRVGAQVSHDWCRPDSSGYLPCGPAHGTAEWRENLIRMLEVTARIPDTWVQLIPTFTYKSHNECSQAEWRREQEACQERNVLYFDKMFDRVNEVVTAGDYKHVFWEVFNEVEHPLSQHIKDEDVREMFLHIRNSTSLPVGTDYHGGSDDEVWRGRYPYVWRDVSDYLAFHTPRNPEPTLAVMRDVQGKFKYQKPVFIDETVAWASGEAIRLWDLEGRRTIAMKGRGTEDERMHQVVKHLRDVRRMGWRPLYHSLWGIHSMRPGRIPNYDRDIAGDN